MQRKIMTDEFVWMTFIHTNRDVPLEEKNLDINLKIFSSILKDEVSKNGVSINQVITYYGEKNKVSFIKPNKLKYWTHSIAYRDAENVKADLFTKGY